METTILITTIAGTTTGTVVIIRPLATLACAGYGILAQQTSLSRVDLGSGGVSSTTNVNVSSENLVEMYFLIKNRR